MSVACPSCRSKSTRHRSKTDDFKCAKCGHTFSADAAAEADADEPEDRAEFPCAACGKATRYRERSNDYICKSCGEVTTGKQMNAGETAHAVVEAEAAYEKARVALVEAAEGIERSGGDDWLAIGTGLLGVTAAGLSFWLIDATLLPRLGIAAAIGVGTFFVLFVAVGVILDRSWIKSHPAAAKLRGKIIDVGVFDDPALLATVKAALVEGGNSAAVSDYDAALKTLGEALDEAADKGDVLALLWPWRRAPTRLELWMAERDVLRALPGRVTIDFIRLRLHPDDAKSLIAEYKAAKAAGGSDVAEVKARELLNRLQSASPDQGGQRS